MAFHIYYLVFIALTLSQIPTHVHGWGAEPVSNSLRPTTSFESNFPASTVVVGAGESVQNAISNCDSIVGSSGYCTVLIQGNPSDGSINIDRSRTKLTASGSFDITSSGPVTFIAIDTPGVENVVVENLSLRGHTDSEVYGIFVSGNGLNNIIIRNNNIHDFDGTDNAHGIAVYGTGATPITNVMIELNEVYNMRTGSSESIVVNGNVFRWAIHDNYVHDVNNIAIDAIGGEGTLPPAAGTNVPNPNDAARGGFIEANVVERMSTRTNPAYGSEESWAAAIYVDGARDILIKWNEVDATPWGYEVGAENCITTEDVTVIENKATNSFFGDFLAGGYSPGGYLNDNSIQCNPLNSNDDDEGHGNVQRITVEENEFLTTTGTEDNILVQFRTTFAIIIEPGVTPVNDDGDGSASGDENAIRTA